LFPISPIPISQNKGVKDGAVNPIILLLHSLFGKNITATQEAMYNTVPPIYKKSPLFCFIVEIFRGISNIRIKTRIREIFSV
jgi:hypothetical protein